MKKRITIGAMAALITAALAGQASGAPTTTITLKGKVGPSFTIGLTNSSGAKVTTAKPGTYKFVVQDLSNIHDFHLTGPGVNKVITTVAFKGTKTVTLTLKKGTYKYVCDPHASAMKGSFVVK
jgi:plastocyanin